MASENSFKLDFDPGDDAWRSASEADRKAYRRRVGELAVARKRWELTRALDVSGEKMPARQKPRDDGASGPVLSPHGAESRSQTRLRFSVGKAGTTVWWSHGWGKVLGYHARGEVIGAYLRDVIGLTPAGLKKVEREALAWWKKAHPKRKPEPPPKPTPKRATRARPGTVVPVMPVPIAAGSVKRQPVMRASAGRKGKVTT